MRCLVEIIVLALPWACCRGNGFSTKLVSKNLERVSLVSRVVAHHFAQKILS